MNAKKIPSHTGQPDEMPEHRPSEADRLLPAGAPAHNETADNDRRARIAERAYFHAQRRGFQADRQLEDWLGAEREIDQESRSSGVKEEASLKSDPFADDAISGLASTPRTNEAENIEPDHVQDWAQRLGVQPARLREAIQRVGSRVSDVHQFLQDSQQPRESPRPDDESVGGKKPRSTRKRKNTMDGLNREG